MRTIAFLGDLHVGSRYAVAPPSASLSDHQQHLYDCYVQFCAACDDAKVDTIVLMGDLIHGTNIRGLGRHLMTTHIEEQVEWAIELLRNICFNRRVYGIAGSQYHVLPGGVPAEKFIVEQLGGEWLGEVAFCSFDPSPLTFCITHGQSATFIYQASKLERELNFLNLAAQQDKLDRVDVFVMGHWHTSIVLQKGSQWVVQVPGWALFMPDRPYLRSIGKMQPDIGGTIMWVDKTVRIQPHIYGLPKSPLTRKRRL